MTRGINQIQNIILTLVVMNHTHSMTFNSNSLLAFQIHTI